MITHTFFAPLSHTQQLLLLLPLLLLGTCKQQSHDSISGKVTRQQGEGAPARHQHVPVRLTWLIAGCVIDVVDCAETFCVGGEPPGPPFFLFRLRRALFLPEVRELIRCVFEKREKRSLRFRQRKRAAIARGCFPPSIFHCRRWCVP